MTEQGSDRMEPEPGGSPNHAKKHRLPRKAGEVGGMANSQQRSVYPAVVERLIAEFAGLPGIGRRSAERLAFYILKSEAPVALALAQAVRDVKEQVRHCSVCFNLTDAAAGECSICTDPKRDHAVVLVVEQPKDLIALEQTGMFRGVYHVLMGHLSPLEGIGPQDLTASDLLNRIEHAESNPGGVAIKEVVLGLNPTVEGDGTALYLAEEVRRRGVKVTRLARGLPSGGQLEYANKAVLADAIQGRQSME
jgi:recombination protein RecR